VRSVWIKAKKLKTAVDYAEVYPVRDISLDVISNRAKSSQRKTKTWNDNVIYHYGVPRFNPNSLIFLGVLCELCG